MLQKIRDHSSGWLAMVLLGLLILSFAIWGIDFRFGGSDYLVKVNGEELNATRVLRNYQAQLANYQNAYPEGIPPAQLEQLKRDVLVANARDEALYQYARKQGMRISDQALANFIESRPEFQFDGQFSYDIFKLAAEREGFTTEGFEEFIRRALLGQQIGNTFVQTAFLTQAGRERRGALNGERREVSYVRVPASPYLDDAQPSEEAIREAYEADPDRYMAPEAVRVEYIQLDPEELSADIDVGEDELRALYEHALAAGEFAQEETRKGSHILIAVDGDTDDAAARALADDLLGRIRAGEDFAALAAEYSDDPGSKDRGGELDWSPKAAFVGPFSEALFGMDVGEVSEPVKTRFGYHIIRLDGIRASEPKPFEDVRAELLEQEQLRLASQQIDSLSRELDEAVYDNDDTLQPASDATGLPVNTSGWISRSSGPGIGREAIVREAAFSDSVFLDRRNSQALRVGDGYVYIRVVDVRPAQLRPLEEVSPQIAQRLAIEAAGDRAEEAGKAALARLEEGGTLADVAADLGADVVEDVSATRDGGELPAGLTRAVFSAPVDDELPAYGGVRLPGGDYGLFAISAAQPGPMLDQTNAARVAQTLGSLEFRAMIEDLYSAADVEIRPEALQ